MSNELKEKSGPQLGQLPRSDLSSDREASGNENEHELHQHVHEQDCVEKATSRSEARFIEGPGLSPMLSLGLGMGRA